MKDRIRHSEGYVLVYRPEHPKAPNTGYVYEHRVLMEEQIGRILGPNEIVHHINEDRADNRLENLQLMSKAEHQRHHLDKSGVTDEQIRERLQQGWSYSQFVTIGVWQQRVARIKRELGLLKAAA